jgi:hypothetical protein
MATSTPLWKLRRLAPRAKRVLERRKQEAPVLLAYEPTLVPAADTYVTAYDQAARAQSRWRKENNEGRSAVYELVVAVRSWIPLLVRDVLGFEGVTLSAAAVPDDAIEEALRVLGIVIDHVDAAGNPLPYQDAARGELEAKLNAARKEVSEAEGADATYQQLLAAARTAGEAFHAELKAFRRTLSVVLGRQDRDYQKLRAQRAAQRDEDDDAAAPRPPDVDEPAIAAVRTSA